MWKPNSLGQPIAQREATFARGDETVAVTIRFGAPVRSPKPEEADPWWCPLQINGLGSEKIHAIAGLDSLQALALALRFTRGYLADEAQRHGGEIYWLTEDLDAVFDERESVRILSDMCGEAVEALKAAEPLLRGQTAEEAQEVAAIVSRVVLKYTRDLRLGDGARVGRHDDADRDVYERAKEVYLHLRDKFESTDST